MVFCHGGKRPGNKILPILIHRNIHCVVTKFVLERSRYLFTYVGNAALKGSPQVFRLIENFGTFILSHTNERKYKSRNLVFFDSV